MFCHNTQQSFVIRRIHSLILFAWLQKCLRYVAVKNSKNKVDYCLCYSDRNKR